MYDNIGFYCGASRVGVHNLLRHIANKGRAIEIDRSGVQADGVPFAYISIIGANDQKLTFVVTPDKLTLTGKNSSICKFYLGNNFETMTLKQFNEAMDAISFRLGDINIRNAIVCSIDLATNFNMTYEPCVYNSCFVSLSRYQKGEINGNLYFKTRDIVINFYDKKKEYRQKRYKIPDKFKDAKNVFRYEIRFKKGLKKKFGRKIEVKDLCNPVFFKELVNLWKVSYLKIGKQNPIVFNSETKTCSTSDFKNYFLFKGMESTGGINCVYKMIESSKKTGGINKDNASYLKKVTKKTYAIAESFDGVNYDYVSEINTKMKEFKPKLE